MLDMAETFGRRDAEGRLVFTSEEFTRFLATAQIEQSLMLEETTSDLRTVVRNRDFLLRILSTCPESNATLAAFRSWALDSRIELSRYQNSLSTR
jgi:hypothetical protein